MKTVLLTGSSRGIGFALAELLLAKGYFVIGTSRDGKSKIKNTNFYSIILDLVDEDSIDNVLNILKSKSLKIDILINNAGIGPDLDFMKPTLNTFQETIATNVTGLVFFTEKVLELMDNGSEIYNISSKMGSIGLCLNSDSVAYRLSKASVNMYSKILAIRLKPQNIKVVSIHPGWVKTEISPGNIPLAPLTPIESAQEIVTLMNSNKKTGTFWNAATQEEMEW
jgi:NAD(P)-dependent dehydrogenase (short-subunit alcohol dehydrogenase family)